MTIDSLGCLHGVPWNKQCTTCGREAEASWVERLKNALRVATHRPHDEDGPTDQASGFKTCSGCGAILTGGLERDTSWSPIARIDAALLADVLATVDVDPYKLAAEYNRLTASAASDGLPSVEHRQADELGHASDGQPFHVAQCVKCGLMLAYLVRDQVECTRFLLGEESQP